jgi:hypothetical protein
MACELPLFVKKIMGKDYKGQPSGPNKEKRTGVRPVMPAENLEGMDEMIEKSRTDQDDLKEKYKERHPNKDKNNASNSGGHRH